MYYFSTYVKQLRDIRKYNCVFEYWDANILQVACVPYKFVCKIKKKSYRRVLYIFFRIVTGCCSQQDLSLRQPHRFRMNPASSPFNERAWKAGRIETYLCACGVLVCRGPSNIG